jgi:hypothetical protein
MRQFSKKIVLNSKAGYSETHDQLLIDLIEAEVMLFCTVGKDCELWHDIMDELFVGDGTISRDFEMMTTWHPDEKLEDVIEFAKRFDINCPDNEPVQVIEV